MADKTAVNTSKKKRNFIRIFFDMVKSRVSTKIHKNNDLGQKINKILGIAFKWIYLVVNGFIKDQCLLRASALTYTLVLSIVPLLAVAFSILKGFGFQNTDVIREFVYKLSAGREAVTENILQFVNNTNVGALGAIGVGFLLFTVISLLGNIEKAFNVVWGVQKDRSFGKKFTDYLSVTIISPLLLIVAMSATATLNSNSIVQKILSISVFAKLYLVLLTIIPYFFVCLVFTFLYSFMPNTKVKLIPALSGGIIAGVTWQLAQWVYIKFQVGVVKYNAIYGTFAQIPLFLVWIYMSWVIVLLGTEISFAVQNFKTYSREAIALKLSNEIKQRLAVRLLIALTYNFESEDTPHSNEVLAEKLRIPVKLVNEILYMLEQEKIVIKIDRTDGEFYTLIRPPDKIRVNQIISYINKYKEVEFTMNPDKDLVYINKLFMDVDAVVEQSRAKVTIKELIAAIEKIKG